MSDVALKARIDDLNRQLAVLTDHVRQATSSVEGLQQKMEELQALLNSQSIEIQELKKTKASRGARATKATA